MVDAEDSRDEREKDDGKPAWASRFQAKLDSIEKPKKVTRDDVLNRWDDSYAKRVEVAKNVREPTTIAKIVTGVCLAASVWMGLSTSSGGGSFDSSSKANQAQISTLQGQLTQAQNAKPAVASSKQGASLVVDAFKQAQGAATVQNDMVTLSKHDDADKMATLSKKMLPFLGQQAYAGSSQWYYIDPASNNPYHATNYQWSAETPYEFDTGGSTIRVTWLCRDTKSHVVLAWAQGDYHADTKKFEGLAWGSTLEGTRRVGTPVDTDNSDDAGTTSSSSNPTSNAKSSPSASTTSSASKKGSA